MGSEAAPELGRSEATAQEARRAANRRKVREHRLRLRAQGMRPIQIWVPDVHSPRQPGAAAHLTHPDASHHGRWWPRCRPPLCRRGRR